MATTRLATIAAGLVLVLTGCAPPADDTDAASDQPSSSPSESASSGSTEPKPREKKSAEPEEPAAPTLEVSVAGDQVGPNARRLELAVGEPLVLEFRSDRAGELHVHSKPEQYVDFAAGRSRAELVVETPGTVEIEEHETGAVVAVLEVS